MLQGACHCRDVGWQCDRMPVQATVCNCTVCRRYGVIWAYGILGEDIHVWGETRAYNRSGGDLSFHFCRGCGCVSSWQPRRLEPGTEQRVAVNLRLAEPEAVAGIAIRRFDGLDGWTSLPVDGRCVADFWA